MEIYGLTHFSVYIYWYPWKLVHDGYKFQIFFDVRESYVLYDWVLFILMYEMPSYNEL